MQLPVESGIQELILNRIQLEVSSMIAEEWADGLSADVLADPLSRNLIVRLKLLMYGRIVGSDTAKTETTRVPVSWFDHVKLDLIEWAKFRFGSKINVDRWVKSREIVTSVTNVRYHCIPYSRKGGDRLTVPVFISDWGKPFTATQESWLLALDIADRLAKNPRCCDDIDIVRMAHQYRYESSVL